MIHALGVIYVKWAILAQNTPAETREKPQFTGGGAAKSAADSADSVSPTPTTASAFAEAVVMLARLPLTDEERAEAVRRLLAHAPDTPQDADE